MSGGADGLTGYIYQQRYLAWRVLSSVAAGLLPGYSAQVRIKEFTVEGPNESTGPVWDVRLCLDDDSVHLRECKDTAITKEDRAIFYRRVRQEVQARQTVQKLTVGWVTDPEKQGNILEHLVGMARLVTSEELVIPASRPQEVRCPETALSEAIYCLCFSPTEEDRMPPALSLDNARDLLSRLAIEPHRMPDLKEAVRLLAEGTFTAGTGESIDKYIQGELSTRISQEKKASYTVQAFLEAVNVGTLALQISGTLADLLHYHSGAGSKQDIQGICWARLNNVPTKSWLLEERLDDFTPTSCLLTASIGVGKTVCSLQAFANERIQRNGHHVLRVEALDLGRDKTDCLLKLACILCGLAPTWLSIDGLDEVRVDRREEWTLLVRRLLRLPQLTLMLTARKEVVTAYPWLQDFGLPERVLDRLTERQVVEEFQRVGLPVPENPSLLAALRTPLLFSFYARIVTPKDLPLTRSGEVTGFQVIEAFWQRTVVSTSVGHRSPGDADQSQHPKRLAAEHITKQTLNGDILLRPGCCTTAVAGGYENLRREGVITSSGTYTFRWVHDWLREYAIIDHVASMCCGQTIASLLDEITGMAVEHVRRTAAVAGAKWVICHSEWGTTQEYLLELWDRHKGYAADVLAVLVEGDSRHLALNQLPAPLLADLIEQARMVRAWRWREQVAALPREKFLEDEGRLHDVVTAYEVEAAQ